jgi:phosphatidylglycerophosphatase A
LGAILNIILPQVNSFKRKITLIFASGAGVGYSPHCPGTLGTLLAIPISLAFNFLAQQEPIIGALFLAGLTVGAIWLSTQAARLVRQKDPQFIVIDEIIGFMIGNFLAPARLAPLAISFLLFRFFDIAKIYPSAQLERLPAGAGIVLDDAMAGLYTFAIVQGLLHWRLL